jgi:hypothetical protein
MSMKYKVRGVIYKIIEKERIQLIQLSRSSDHYEARGCIFAIT